MNNYVFPFYTDHDGNEIVTVFDAYIEYLSERTAGTTEADNFNDFLSMIDGCGITEDGQKVPLW